MVAILFNEEPAFPTSWTPTSKKKWCTSFQTVSCVFASDCSCWVAKEIETKLVILLVVKVPVPLIFNRMLGSVGPNWFVVLNWWEEIPSAFGECAFMCICYVSPCACAVFIYYNFFILCYVLLDDIHNMWYAFVGWLIFQISRVGYADELTNDQVGGGHEPSS